MSDVLSWLFAIGDVCYWWCLLLVVCVDYSSASSCNAVEVSKNGLLKPFIHKNDLFTKTGSRQP